VLKGDSRVTPINHETIAVLNEKHPDGPDSPFTGTEPPVPYSPEAFPADLFDSVIASFRPDTAPGPSGWTVPLLRHVLRAPSGDLGAVLGPDHLVVAYLDDIYILGPDDGILDCVELFLSEADTTLCLNSSKSETHSLDAIRDNGISLLGTCVGPRTARHAFLSTSTSNLNENSSSGSPASRSNTPCFSFAFLYSRIFATSTGPYVPPTSQSCGIASTPYCGTACTRFGL